MSGHLVNEREQSDRAGHVPRCPWLSAPSVRPSANGHVPFKVGTTGEGPELWGEMCGLFVYCNDELERHYSRFVERFFVLSFAVADVFSSRSSSTDAGS
jgi:hypothetical protein